jgi:hypothetical protein
MTADVEKFSSLQVQGTSRLGQEVMSNMGKETTRPVKGRSKQEEEKSRLEKTASKRLVKGTRKLGKETMRLATGKKKQVKVKRKLEKVTTTPVEGMSTWAEEMKTQVKGMSMWVRETRTPGKEEMSK